MWDEFRNHFPKRSRYTFDAKVDSLFLDIVELLFVASSLPRDQKFPVLQRASGKLDSLKFFLRITWELKILDNNKYIKLSESLNNIGRMLGGWMKNAERETPAIRR